MGLDDSSHCDSPRKRSNNQCPDAIMRESFNTGGYVERRQEFENGGQPTENQPTKKKKSTIKETVDTIGKISTFAAPFILGGGAYIGNKLYNKYKNTISPETITKLKNTYNTVRDGISKVDHYKKNPQDLLKDAANHFAPKQQERDLMPGINPSLKPTGKYPGTGRSDVIKAQALKAQAFEQEQKAMTEDRKSTNDFSNTLKKNLEKNQLEHSLAMNAHANNLRKNPMNTFSNDLHNNSKKNQAEHRLAMQEAERKTALERVSEQELADIAQKKRLREKIADLKNMNFEGL